MNVEFKWFLDLPFDITCTNSFYNTKLSKYEFEFDDIKIKFRKEKESEVVKKIIVSCDGEYDDEFLPSHDYIEYLSEFSDEMTLKAGLVTQRFFDGISKATVDEVLSIFDGEDFSCEYQLNSSPGILSGGGGIDSKLCNVNDNEIEKAIAFTKRTNTYLDNAWYLLREVEVSYEMGKYELCFLNMAIMCELLVTSALDDYLCSNGRFKSQYKDKLIASYGERPSFADRYFKYGLTYVSDDVLDQEIIDAVDFVYKVRDKLAHGNILYEVPIIKDTGINVGNIRLYIWSLFNDMSLVYDYFVKIEGRID